MAFFRRSRSGKGDYDHGTRPVDPNGFGWFGRIERHLIRVRTGEGRERAVANGVVMGRKLKLNPHQRREALARRAAGELLRDIAKTYNVAHSTIARLR